MNMIVVTKFQPKLKILIFWSKITQKREHSHRILHI